MPIKNLNPQPKLTPCCYNIEKSILLLSENETSDQLGLPESWKRFLSNSHEDDSKMMLPGLRRALSNRSVKRTHQKLLTKTAKILPDKKLAIESRKKIAIDTEGYTKLKNKKLKKWEEGWANNFEEFVNKSCKNNTCTLPQNITPKVEFFDNFCLKSAGRVSTIEAHLKENGSINQAYNHLKLFGQIDEICMASDRSFKVVYKDISSASKAILYHNKNTVQCKWWNKGLKLHFFKG